MDIPVNFLTVATQFVDASCVAWPSDPLLPLASVTLKKLEPQIALDLFETTFGSLVNSLAKKDVEALYKVGSHEALTALCIKEKYDGANEATREVLCSYIGNMCKIVSMKRLYKHIPNGVLGAVTDAAQKLKTRLDSGTLDVSTLNPYDIGKEVMDKFNPNELESMMKDFMKNEEAMETVMTQMSAMMNGPGGAKLSEQMATAFANGMPGGGIPGMDGLNMEQMLASMTGSMTGPKDLSSKLPDMD